MAETDSFDDFEKQGRALFYKFTQQFLPAVTHVNFTLDKFGRTDVNYLSACTATVGEIKTRKYKHTRFSTWLLQRDKYLELLKEGAPATYINVFFDAIVIWRLNDLPLRWRYEYHSKTHEKKVKVKKLVAYLPLDMASHVYKLDFTSYLS